MSTETKGINVRYNWLEFKFACAIVFAGSAGLGQLLGFNLTGYPPMCCMVAGLVGA
jgi:hypothetical protein